jgi:hypothetical protein
MTEAYRGGANMYISWASNAGPVTLQGDYKTFTYTPSIDLYDQSGGGDTNKSYVNGIKDGQAAIMVLMQTGGTATTNALVEGASGTLTVGPEGTAATKQKIVLPAISQGAGYNWPYDNLVEVSCNFQQNGTRTDGVW